MTTIDPDTGSLTSETTAPVEIQDATHDTGQRTRYITVDLSAVVGNDESPWFCDGILHVQDGHVTLIFDDLGSEPPTDEDCEQCRIWNEHTQ
jgi:hypothetical protein